MEKQLSIVNPSLLLSSFSRVLKTQPALLLTAIFFFVGIPFIGAQNVGIADNNPPERLSIKGNFLVKGDFTSSSSQPDAQHTSSIAAGVSDSNLVIIDSVYRILDPGGAGNYAANIPLSLVALSDTTGASTNTFTGALELTVEFINLGTGDSFFVVNALNSSVLLRAGSNLNTNSPLVFSGNIFVLYFSSNSDASVGQGFSAVIRKLYPVPPGPSSSGTQNNGNAALFFDSEKGSFKAGVGNAAEAGFGSVSLGAYNRATGPYTVAIGNTSRAESSSDVAIAGGQASGQSSVAIGSFAAAVGTNSQAFGFQARAEGSQSSALTSRSLAVGFQSAAIGTNSRAYAVSSVALTGGTTETNYNWTTAIGFGSTASGNHSIAAGRNAATNGEYSLALGDGSRTNSEYALALGRNARANGSSSVAIGTNSTSSVVNSVAMGAAESNGIGSVAIGTGSYTNGLNAVAVGHLASARGTSSMAFGYNVEASGANSTAMGNYVSTSDFPGSFAIGDNSTTTVMNTFVENGFRARFAKGYRLFTNSATTIGAFLNENSNSWAALSDFRLKENILPVNGESVLKKIVCMPLGTWNYIGQDPKTLRHYGPMAQDFYAAFGADKMGVIGCDTLINQQDFLGVNLIAIQALIHRSEILADENKQLKEKINLLQKKEIENNQAIDKRLKELENLIQQQNR